MQHTHIVNEIQTFVETYRRANHAETHWHAPLVGFADARDALFSRLRGIVRSSHAVPEDLLPGAQTVIAYFLPFHQDIANSNRNGRHASRAWALAYIETNRLIVELNDNLANVLANHGFQAAVLPPTHNFDEEELLSDWSHKHVAYIAGLGNFGLHHLLITEKGCCGRLGSLVTDAPLQATPRTDAAYCLYAYNGSCQACVKKCVNGALTENSLNRHRCYVMLLENAKLHEDAGYADACGKCTCVVPCSFSNPVTRLAEQ
jgi:epoxyqueuosine reductase QueG